MKGAPAMEATHESATDETPIEQDEATPEADPEVDPAEDADPEGAEELGDPGKRALDAMKAKWRAERDARRKLEQQLVADQPDTNKPIAEVLARANARIVRSEVKAAAKGKLSDPSDAYRFLDLEQFEVTEDGDVDEEEIAAAIDDLIKSKPYLAAQGRRFQGSAEQGVRKSPGVRQLSREDLRGMTPHQISEAKAKGQLADLLKTTT